jgi:hypothetical protein
VRNVAHFALGQLIGELVLMRQLRVGTAGAFTLVGRGTRKTFQFRRQHMRNILRLLASVAMFALIFTLTSPVAGLALTVSCTDQYSACLNVSGQQAEPFQTLGDIECGLEYTGCVARKLKFW